MLTYAVLVRMGLLVGAYVLAARVGFSLDAVGGFAALVWLPSGLAVVALMAGGQKYWPGVFLGALIANYINGAPAGIAFLVGIGNCLEALIATYLLRKATFRASFDRVRDVTNFIIWGCFLSPVASATIGVASLTWASLIPMASFVPTWRAWWTGDMFSILVFGAFLLVWSARRYRTLLVIEKWERWLLVVVLIVVGTLVFTDLFDIRLGFASHTYLVFPPLIWAALRFGPREAISANFLLSAMAVWGTIQGFGPFTRQTISGSLMYLHSFLMTISVSSLILAAAIEERRQLEKRKEDFIGIASHELKTPITSMKLYVQSLRKHRKKPSAALLARLENQINRLVYLINNLLDASKIVAGKVELQKETFLLTELVKDIIAELSVVATHFTITCSGPKVTVTADKEKISQVITNLLLNAIKYSLKSKKIVVKITKNPQEVVVNITDFGMGIAVKHQQKIFDRFYRIEKMTGGQAGLGIGLYICQEIARQHKGKITVRSKLGKGSTFSLHLPLPF